MKVCALTSKNALGAQGYQRPLETALGGRKEGRKALRNEKAGDFAMQLMASHRMIVNLKDGLEG